MFGRNSRRHHHTTGPALTTGTNSRRSGRRSIFHRADPDRRAGGFKAALHNPNTTHEGRKHAKHELRMMQKEGLQGRGNEAHGHPSITSRIKHALGIRSRSSRARTTNSGGRFGFSRRRY